MLLIFTCLILLLIASRELLFDDAIDMLLTIVSLFAGVLVFTFSVMSLFFLIEPGETELRIYEESTNCGVIYYTGQKIEDSDSDNATGAQSINILLWPVFQVDHHHWITDESFIDRLENC